MSHAMPLATAARILREIDGNCPWSNSTEFLRAMAAHSAVFVEELRRRTHHSGVTLTKLIHNACQPSRMGWLFNNLRLLHALPECKRQLIASGTTANEAFHHEINNWFKNQADIFSSTVQLQLSIATLGKQLAHCSSLYVPTLRQMRQQDVLSAVAACLRHPPEVWTSFCAALRKDGVGLRKSDLPLARMRKQIAARIKSAAKKPAAALVIKRPAGRAHHVIRTVQKRPAGSLKRTAFTLNRPESLARCK